MKEHINKIKDFGKFLEENKILITSSIYGLGIFFQIIMLMIFSGFQGFFFVSLKFSLIIFGIFLFIFFISIPFFFFFWFGLFLTGVFLFWGAGIYGKIFIGIYFFTLLFGKLILKKWFPKKLELIQNKLSKSNFDKFTTRFIILTFILIFSSLGYAVFGKKIVVINTAGKQVIMGELNFYNQEYYFLNVCGNKVILSNTEVKSVNLLGDRFYYSGNENKEKLKKINTDYDNFCNSKPIIKLNK